MEKAKQGIKNGMNVIGWWGILKTPESSMFKEGVVVPPPSTDQDHHIDRDEHDQDDDHQDDRHGDHGDQHNQD